MRNQVFLVFDSLRWDVFDQANLPFLRSLGTWKKALTPGNYTLPAHMSFFVGKLPQTLDQTDYYDTAAVRISWYGRSFRGKPLWQLSNPESPRKAICNLHGKNVIEGFSRLGYTTIGTGAMNWFNPELSAGRYLTESFDHFSFMGCRDQGGLSGAEAQVAWVLKTLRSSQEPYFLFMNFGETHHPYIYEDCPWIKEKQPYGNASKCRARQTGCIEYLDGLLRGLLGQLENYDLVICSDHGDAFGEDGLWGHSFSHPTVLEVPLLIQLG